jgi:hypothetical protein
MLALFADHVWTVAGVERVERRGEPQRLEVLQDPLARDVDVAAVRVAVRQEMGRCAGHPFDAGEHTQVHLEFRERRLVDDVADLVGTGSAG